MSGAAEIDTAAWAALLGCDGVGLLACTDSTERVARLAVLQRAVAIDRDRMHHQAKLIAAEVSRLFRR